MKKILNWQLATVQAIHQETPRIKTFTLALPEWTAHQAGQHYDVRLTAPDGYQAQRSYSIASEPERQGVIDLTVERLEDGEVSTYLHDVLVVGDQVELRGPIGGYFVWDAKTQNPLLLIGGGTGVVPLMAMVRHRYAACATHRTHLLYSARAYEDLIYYQELERLSQAQDGFQVFFTLTRSQPAGWTGYSRRIDRLMLHEVTRSLGRTPQVYICGPTLFVETIANDLVEFGIPAQQILTERFGPTS